MSDIKINTNDTSTYWDDPTSYSDASLDSAQGLAADALTAALTGMANAQAQDKGDTTTKATSADNQVAASSSTSVDETSPSASLAAPTGAAGSLNSLDEEESKKHGFSRLRHHHDHI